MSDNKINDIQHEQDCDKNKDYSDGFFNLCLCQARLMNTFAGTNFVNKNDKRPSKVISVALKP